MRKLPQKRVVLLTGASTGIGLAVLNKLVAKGFRVVATARKSSLPRFTDLGIQEGPDLMIRSLDVTDLAEQERLVEEIDRCWGGVDVLVNNAGVSYRTVTEHIESEEEMDQFMVNYFGPLNLIRLVLPSMRQKGFGHVLNVSSVGGTMAMPTMGAYSASKFALEGASETLWYEMSLWGIRVCIIEPGFVHSYGFKNVKMTPLSLEASQDLKNPYYFYYHYLSRMVERFMELSPSTPNKIAQKILRVIEDPAPPLRIPATLDAWMFYILRRILPRRFYHYLMYKSLPHIDEWVRPEEP